MVQPALILSLPHLDWVLEQTGDVSVDTKSHLRWNQHQDPIFVFCVHNFLARSILCVALICFTTHPQVD